MQMGGKGEFRLSKLYVLGAGFSKPAGYPLQDEILTRIKEIVINRGLMDNPLFAETMFQKGEQRLRKFINDIFPGNPTPSLEDLFTLLDQSIELCASCKEYTYLELDEIREALKTVILFVFHDATNRINNQSAQLYRLIAAHLIQHRISNPLNICSVVSVNWDPLIEESIYWWVKKVWILGKVDVDYCCYTTPLSEETTHVPSLLQKARGINNIKVMKLHGSANWLICPRCGRLFTGLGSQDSVWELYYWKQICPYCRKEKKKEKETSRPKLEPFLVSPTFVKRFSNPHIQMTWHNAYLDLSEAKDEVVFIGYSLPEADYHVRTLLARSIDLNAKIICVTKDDQETVDRYYAFFGKHRVEVVRDGVEAYFGNLLGDCSMKAWESRLRRAIKNV
jgi:hypothetical protein